MIRLMGEYLPVKILRLPQPSGPVVLQCQIESLLDGDLGHARQPRLSGIVGLR
jgi:hypothetical protein